MPPIDPPIIVPKVNDQGTPETSDDRIVPGATFEFRRDDGDGIYEPVGDDAPVLAEIDATNGFAVFTPAEPGDYWVTESTPPPGLESRRPDPRRTTPHRRRTAVSPTVSCGASPTTISREGS